MAGAADDFLPAATDVGDRSTTAGRVREPAPKVAITPAIDDSTVKTNARLVSLEPGIKPPRCVYGQDTGQREYAQEGERVKQFRSKVWSE